MRLQFVRNYLFIFDNNDGRGREETGQIELSDDDEAFVFGEQVIQEMMQGSGRQYAGCAMELYDGGRIVGRIPLDYRKPSHCGTSALPHSEKLPRHDLDDSCFDMTGRPGSLNQEATVSPAGAVFPPDLIELMKLVLNDVTALLPELKRTSSIKVEIASNILACAARGERNPAALKAAALLGTVSVD